MATTAIVHTDITAIRTGTMDTVLTLIMDTALTGTTADTTVIDPTGVATGDAIGGAGIKSAWEEYMRNVIVGISAAIALLFIGTLDADAAKISGSFCCGAGAHQVCCSRTRGCPCGVPTRPQCCKQYGTWHCPCPAPAT